VLRIPTIRPIRRARLIAVDDARIAQITKPLSSLGHRPTGG
jgi:hypothetical protein